MFESFKITDSFTPLMLGSISLIAFLSIRNAFLATKTREVCKELLQTNDELWQYSYLHQLRRFVHRYKLNNVALMSAICSVFLFGLMIAFTDMFQFSLSLDLKKSGTTILLILGGGGATAATVISIIETFNGRHSLFTFVATTLIKLNILESKYPIAPIVLALERKIKEYIPQNVEDELAKILIKLK